MNRRRFTKLLREYPYLLDDAFIRSRSEAQSIYEEGFPSLSEVVARAKARSELTAESWAYFEKSAAEAELKAKRKKTRKEQAIARKSNILAHRRMAIACAILAIILAFFTLFPAGRALAKEIFDYILNVFGSRIEIVSSDYQDGRYHPTAVPLPIENTDVLETVIEYADLAEFTEATGLIPFSLEIAELDCISIIEENSVFAGRTLQSDYRIGSDGLLTIWQKWTLDGKLRITGNDDFDNKLSVRDGVIIHYSIDKHDGSFTGVCLLEDSLCKIYINKEPYIAQFLYDLQN